MTLHLQARGVVAGAVLLTLALALSSCGGNASGAPEDASRADFCEAIVNSPDDLASDEPDAAVEAAHDYAERLAEIGTPDVDDDARAGFELYVDFLAEVDADDISELKDAEFSDVFEGEDLEKFEALTDVTADCGPGEY